MSEARLPAYLRDAYLRELPVEIVDIGETDGRPWAVLDDTVLYPGGGGQPADRGWLDDIAVVDVSKEGGRLLHWVEKPVAYGPAALLLDWGRRYDHMQQHTAQHVLTAVALRFGWPTTAFHLGEERCDIELGTESIDAAALQELQEAVASEVRAAHTVTASWTQRAELEALGARSRGLSEDLQGPLRLVGIEGVDLCTCGGTHLRSTAEIEALQLLGTEPMRGGTRLFWVAGGRARQRLADHEARAAALRATLTVGDGDVVDAVAGLARQLREERGRARRLEEKLAQEVAARLAGGDGAQQVHVDGADAGFLELLAHRFREAAPGGRLLATASSEAGHFFALALGADAGVDSRSLGARVAAVLDGRGGGPPGIFKGRAGSLARRDEALAMLADAAD